MIGCRITGNDFQCNAPLYEFLTDQKEKARPVSEKIKLSLYSSWNSIFNFKTGQSKIFYVDHQKIASCRVKYIDPTLAKFPLIEDNMDCEFIKNEAFDFLKEDLMFEDLTYSKDLEDVEIIINRYHNFDKSSLVFGYLSVDF